MKMMTKKIIKILLIGFVTTLFSFSQVLADSETDQAKASANRIKSELKTLKRLARKSKIRTALANFSTRNKSLDDSDSDGLPDVIENALGSSSCDSDSDDDGISDDDEGHSGSNPDDSSSGEVEIKGNISAISETTVTVDGKTFTVNSNTQYEDGASLSAYHVGDRVEVSGKIISGVLTLKKIKIED